MRIVALTFHDVVADNAAHPPRSDEFYRITLSEFEKTISELRKLG